jgi:hypothetical protein
MEMNAVLKVATHVMVSTGTTLVFVGGGTATDTSGARWGVALRSVTGATAANLPVTGPASIEELEDRLDIAAARAALAESEASISYEDARRELGLR